MHGEEQQKSTRIIQRYIDTALCTHTQNLYYWFAKMVDDAALKQNQFRSSSVKFVRIENARAYSMQRKHIFERKADKRLCSDAYLLSLEFKSEP